jgi:hypothetical protein
MKFFKKSLIIILFAISIIGGAVLAGQLTPTGAPGTSFVTLTDIYEKILDNTYATSSRSYEPSSAPAGTHYTLQQIFDAIPNIDPEKIISGHNILGVDGAYDVSNLTPDKVRLGTTYGTSSEGTWELPITDYYLLEGFGEANANGIYYDSGITMNGKKVFVNENNIQCIAYFDSPGNLPSYESVGWATASFYPDISGPEKIGAPRYCNPQGSANPEDGPWRQFFEGDFFPLPIGTVTKVGEPNP